MFLIFISEKTLSLDQASGNVFSRLLHWTNSSSYIHFPNSFPGEPPVLSASVSYFKKPCSILARLSNTQWALNFFRGQKWTEAPSGWGDLLVMSAAWQKAIYQKSEQAGNFYNCHLKNSQSSSARLQLLWRTQGTSPVKWCRVPWKKSLSWDFNLSQRWLKLLTGQRSSGKLNQKSLFV